MDNALLVATVVLSSVSLAAALVAVLLLSRRRALTPHEIGSAVSQELGFRLGEAIGQVQSEAADIRKTHRTLEQMLRTPGGRGSFGEQSLEVILQNNLPPDCYGIRKECFGGKKPDAHIRAGEEIICIDSKFPSANFHKLMACSDEKEKAPLFKRFLADVKDHLEKVANDYVCPEQGAKFALMFIPSEAVYYSLITDPGGYELLNRYAFRGVQVVSPLLLAHKIEILKLSICAVRLNERAEEVQAALHALGRRFGSLRKAWKLCSSHLRHLDEAMAKLDSDFGKVYLEFRRISKETALDGEGPSGTESPLPKRGGKAPVESPAAAPPTLHEPRPPEPAPPGARSTETEEAADPEPATASIETEGAADPAPAPDSAEVSPPRPTEQLEWIEGATYDAKYKKATAVIIYEQHKFRVLKGSTAIGDLDPSLELKDHPSKMLLDQLVNSGKLLKRSDGLYEFSADVEHKRIPPILHIVTGRAILTDQVLVRRGG